MSTDAPTVRVRQAESGGSSPNKRHKGHRSCAECRRLKTKCDSGVPCAGCVKRGRAQLCPDKTFGSSRELYDTGRELADRVQQLEKAFRLQAHSQSHQAPSTSELNREQTREKPVALNNVENVVQASSALQSAFSLTTQPTVGSAYDTLSTPIDQGGASIASSGTLIVTTGGRSRFIGPSASSQVLREGMQAESRDASPPIPDTIFVQNLIDFPGFTLFRSPDQSMYLQACSSLPDRQEVNSLVETYFRLVAWTGTPVLHADMVEVTAVIYRARPQPSIPQDIALSLQNLALVYIVIALGGLMNLEIPPNDPETKHHFGMAQHCLFHGAFLTYHTLTGVQVLSLMAKFAAYSDMKKGKEVQWQIRGVASRIMHAMGLHRDGERWGLATKDLNDRRRVFWESFSSEVFMSKNWDRPSAIMLEHLDTKFPQDQDVYPDLTASFERKRYELAIMSKRVLDESLRLKASEYSDIKSLWQEMISIENSIPFELKCRPMLKAMVSVYKNPGDAERASTQPSRKNIRLAFQQHTLALGSCENVTSILRPYFVAAIQQHSADPAQSAFGEVYLAVIERSSMIISTLKGLHDLFPLVTARHWYFWLHAYSAAVCMATVCIVTPTSLLRDLAMSCLETTIQLFEGALESLPRSLTSGNLDFLKFLRSQARAKIAAVGAVASVNQTSNAQMSPAMTANHLEMVGWTTRLVRLAKTGVDWTEPPSIASCDNQGGQWTDPTISMPTQPPSLGQPSYALWNGIGDDPASAPLVPPFHGLPSEGVMFPRADSPDMIQQLLTEHLDVPLNSSDFSFDLQQYLGLPWQT